MNPLAWLAWLKTLHPVVGYVVLFGASLIEYIIPPFPGDTVTLVGAVMIGAAEWSFVAVLGTTTLGSVVGAWIDYEAGRWLQATDRESWLHRQLRSPRVKPRIDRVIERFARYGPAFIMANRFLPAIRSVFFVAAGMAGLRRGTVLLYAGVSALAWNALIIGVGYLVGFNLETLDALFQRYTRAIWIALGVGAAVWLGWKLWGWWRERRSGSGTGGAGAGGEGEGEGSDG